MRSLAHTAMKNLFHLLLLLSVSAPAFGAALVAATAPPTVPKRVAPLPTPDLANEKYGPHARNVLDLWKAKSETPTPLVVYIHGGGFSGGSKESLSPVTLAALLKAGISVLAINYRLAPEFHFPAHYLDSARAIQYARLHAKEWNLDPKRVGATGGSAGAGTSLWIGFHDDLADPKSDDPVLRQTTRLSAMVVHGAQSSYDPRVIKEWVGEAASLHPFAPGFYGVKLADFDTPAAHKLFEDASAITHLTRDDPPVLAFYGEPRGPVPANARPGTGIHHINFGLKLKERMDKLGLECVVRHSDEKPDVAGESVAFFQKYFGVAK